MSKFIEAVKIAYKKIKVCNKLIKKSEIENVWIKSCIEVGFLENIAKKSCSKNSFLGVIRSGIFSLKSDLDKFKVTKNEKYAIDAIKILKTTNKSYNPKELWDIIGNKDKSYNYQMHVVLALWEEIKINV